MNGIKTLHRYNEECRKIVMRYASEWEVVVVVLVVFDVVVVLMLFMLWCH